jgi:hypothetical protein
MGATWDVRSQNTILSGMNCLWDHADLYNQGVTFPGDSPRCVQNLFLYSAFYYCGFRGTRLASTPVTKTSEIFYPQESGCSVGYSYVGGGKRASYVWGSSGYFYASRTVIDDMSIAGLHVDQARFNLQDYGDGVRTTIRDCPLGVLLVNGAVMPTYTSYQLSFENIVGPCIRVGSRCVLDCESGNDAVIQNGPAGGNADVGIEVNGPNACVNLGPNVSVSGALGDVHILEDEVVSYATIAADGPLVDGGLNTVGVL